jgi:hypothetical protein
MTTRSTTSPFRKARSNGTSTRRGCATALYRDTETDALYRGSANRWPLPTLLLRARSLNKRDSSRSREQQEEPIGVDTRRRVLLDAKVDNTRRALLERTADIVAAYLGATLVIAGETKSKKSSK